jgi:hypothetical protein
MILKIWIESIVDMELGKDDGEAISRCIARKHCICTSTPHKLIFSPPWPGNTTARANVVMCQYGNVGWAIQLNSRESESLVSPEKHYELSFTNTITVF